MMRGNDGISTRPQSGGIDRAPKTDIGTNNNTQAAASDSKMARGVTSNATQTAMSAMNPTPESVQKDLETAVNNADNATTDAALMAGTEELNQSPNRTRSGSAQEATNAQAATVLNYDLKNRALNRQTAYSNAVDAGARRLEAAGLNEEAQALKQAGDLQKQSSDAMLWVDAFNDMLGAYKQYRNVK